MLILGIETSCDETAAALVADGRRVLSSAVYSQTKVHAAYRGVVPELASREHVRAVQGVVADALREAGIPLNALSSRVAAIAYTRGPGLAGSLLVGQITAQTISFIARLPLIDVNHLEGHLYAALLENHRLRPPYLALIVSGGHTELVVVEGFGRYRMLGATRDDAAGEAYDKVAKLLGLPYPGGPVIDRLAKTGDPAAIAFPRPYLWESGDFSFSGLKTAVVNHVARHLPVLPARPNRAVRDICASFQQAVIDTLVEKTFAAAANAGMKDIVIGGGVAANAGLRAALTARARSARRKVYLPSRAYCTDNAAMIACAGYYRFAKGPRGAHPFDARQCIEPGMVLRSWGA